MVVEPWLGRRLEGQEQVSPEQAQGSHLRSTMRLVSLLLLMTMTLLRW